MEEEQDWLAEAEAVIQDVQCHVKYIGVSTLDPPGQGLYLNVTTKEDKQFCVLMGSPGFQVVGNEHNNSSLENTNQMCYETPYAMLGSLSPSYNQSFGNLLMEKLIKLSANNR